MNETDWENTLGDIPALEKLQKLFRGIQKMQAVLIALQHDMQEENDQKLTLTKIGTVLTLAVLKKMQGGAQPGSFTKKDWADIANTVVDYAVLMDGREYSEFVFTLYGRYIDASADLMEKYTSEEADAAIRQLPLEITAKTEHLHSGKISEASYIEDCLWICLEGMVKLLAVYTSFRIAAVAGPEFAQLSLAISSFGFEYARLCMYRREQALLEEYIQNQYRLDEELAEKYKVYQEELQTQAKQFNILIDKAFTADFRALLQHSAELARAFGVPEEEVLATVEDVDDFFLN